MPVQTLTPKGRQTRTAIEQAARKLFAERGFHGTTLADITSAAGKSPAVFYRYYADKEDLLAALAESFLRDIVTPSGLSLHLPDSPNDSEFFTSVVTGYWNMFKQNIGIMIAVAQLATTQQRFAGVQNEFRRFGMDIVAASVRRAQEQGHGTELDPEHTAAAIALLFENFTTVVRRAVEPRARDQRRGCHRDALDDLEEDAVRVLTTKEITVDFALPEHLPGLLAEMDEFIEAEIKPLERENIQYFDQRREHARTDWDNGGIPRREWEDLLGEMRRRADKAGWLRYGLPSQFGGRDGSNIDMAVIREHLAHKGLGLHNDLQDESSIVGNFPQVIMMDRFGTDAQKQEWTDALITGERSMAFGLTEPNHGSDATWLETRADADGDDWVINGAKRFNTGVHRATHDLVFARTSGEPGQARGITAFLVPTDARGSRVPYYWWTFNMPTDHGEVELEGCPGVRRRRARRGGPRPRGRPDVSAREQDSAGGEQPRRRPVLHRPRRRVRERPQCVRQAAVGQPGRAVAAGGIADRGADGAAAGATTRRPQLDGNHHMEVSDKVSMANYRANRLVCEAADRAMQVFGGVGYSRHEPFEHIYRHHRRYRITEGAEEIQIRRVAQRLFGFGRK